MRVSRFFAACAPVAALLALGAPAPAAAAPVEYRFEFSDIFTTIEGNSGDLSGFFQFINGAGFIDASGDDGYEISLSGHSCGATLWTGSGQISYGCGTHQLFARDFADIVYFWLQVGDPDPASYFAVFELPPGSFATLGEHEIVGGGGRLLVWQPGSPPPPPPPIPEPGTWALLIAGFGLVGSALRRRARRAEGVAEAA